VIGRVVGSVLGLLLLGCGTPPAIEANRLDFWRILSAQTEFGACSDAADFRDAMRPAALPEDTYLTYRVAADRTTAIEQSCARLEASTCSDAAGAEAFLVSGRELHRAHESTQAIGTTGCQLQQSESWLLKLDGGRMSGELSSVLSIVGEEAACARIEKDLADRSPNQLGAQGCVVTYRFTGELTKSQFVSR
jgi:hypothetical protein